MRRPQTQAATTSIQAPMPAIMISAEAIIAPIPPSMFCAGASVADPKLGSSGDQLPSIIAIRMPSTISPAPMASLPRRSRAAWVDWSNSGSRCFACQLAMISAPRFVI